MSGALSAGGLGLAFDAVVAALLVVTICYAAILNRKLNLLRESKQEMEALLGRFASSAKEAESGLAALREASGAAGETLQDRIARGTALADDLVFLVERGASMADRLEGGTRRGAGLAGSAGGTLEPEPEVAAGAVVDPQQAALIEQLKGVR